MANRPKVIEAIAIEDQTADVNKGFESTVSGLKDDMTRATVGFVNTQEKVKEGMEKAMKTVRPKLLIVDPFQCFLGAGVDMNRSNETRPILAELSNLAERYDCALLLIRHLKKLGDKTIYRGLGTIDIAAAARSVLLAGRNPQPPNLKDVLRTDERGQILHPKDRFALVHTKCNLGRKGPSLDYSIDDNGLTIDGISQLTADDLLNVPIKTGMNGQPDVDEFGDRARHFVKRFTERSELVAIGDAHAMAEIAAADVQRRVVQIAYRACDRAGQHGAGCERGDLQDQEYQAGCGKNRDEIGSQRSHGVEQPLIDQHGTQPE